MKMYVGMARCFDYNDEEYSTIQDDWGNDVGRPIALFTTETAANRWVHDGGMFDLEDGEWDDEKGQLPGTQVPALFHQLVEVLG